ncbi:MAG: hypothetical protein ACODAE_04480 [Gemmatimonadota bacterium]
MEDSHTARRARTHRTHRGDLAARLPRAALVGVVAVATAALVACEDPGATSPADALTAETMVPAGGPAEENAGLATLRRATARYHDVDAAIEDGFVQILPCQESPDGQGALGIPYGKLDRFDTNIDLSKPELLFYEPQADGSLRLVGAEPVVPIEAWDAEHDDPPSLFGREFHRNEDHGLYGLHMWVWRPGPGPDGVFGFWNPRVSCEFADE